MSSGQLAVAPEATPEATRILIAGIGNIFLGDDGFGVEVAQRLMARHYPPGVEVVDFGIRGIELAYTLLDGCDTLLLVDAVPRGGPPGTLYVLEPDTQPLTQPLVARSTLDAHSMDPMKTLAFAYGLGARPRRVLLVGCEPDMPPTPGVDAPLRMGLSAPAQAAVTEAVRLIDELVARLRAPAAAPTQREQDEQGEQQEGEAWP